MKKNTGGTFFTLLPFTKLVKGSCQQGGETENQHPHKTGETMVKITSAHIGETEE